MNWPSIIRTLRERMFLNQRDFGTLFGVTWMSVYRWERGISSPHFSHRAKIIELCREKEVPIKQFILLKK